MYRGWITGAPEDKAFLLGLGVDQIRLWRKNNDGTVTWRCRATDETIEKLDEYFGRFVWGFVC